MKLTVQPSAHDSAYEINPDKPPTDWLLFPSASCEFSTELDNPFVQLKSLLLTIGAPWSEEMVNEAMKEASEGEGV